MTSMLSRALITAGATGGAVLLAAGVASAHVTVAAPDAQAGHFAILTFSVPTESVTASTTKVSVQLPALKAALPQPVPGWTVTVDKDASQQPTAVTWTANPGTGIAPEQFQQFVVAAGPMPDAAEVSFKAAQTYSDGKIVNWDQPKAADGSEPEHPAPSVTLAKGDAKDGHTHGADNAGVPGATEAAHTDTKSSDTTARWLGGIGLVLGALGAALGLGSVLRRRKA